MQSRYKCQLEGDMKPIVIVLASFFVILQYKLWFEQDGVKEVWNLQQAVTQQTQINTEITQRNTVLAAEVNDLKSGQSAIEERARIDLNMIKPGEVFYQIVPSSQSTAS